MPKIPRSKAHLYKKKDAENCGTPNDLLKCVWYPDLDDNPVYIRYCEDCFNISQKERKCLRCDRLFVPGCKIRYLCRPCYSHNKSSIGEILLSHHKQNSKRIRSEE